MASLSAGRIWSFLAGVAVMLGVAGVLSIVRRGASGAIPPPLPLPSPNGFDRYVAAAAAIVPANPPVDAVNDHHILTPAQAAINYAPARRAAWIAANTRAWALFASAQALPTRYPNVRGSFTTMSVWKPLRELARGQSIRVHDWQTRGQWGAAINGGLDTLQMGRSVERGATLIGSLVGMSIEHIAERSIEDVPAHLSAPEARAATRRLETLIAASQPFSEVLREEKWTFLTVSNSSLGGGGAGGTFVSLATSGGRAGYISTMDAFIAGADLPKLARPAVSPPLPALGVFGIYNGMYLPTKASLFNDGSRKSLERLLLLRLALRTYRAQNGAYPTQLSALVPTIIKSVPVDPFGAGEALRYRVAGDSYTAWSIGPDGVDNGGAAIPIPPGAKHRVVRKNSLGDIVATP